ncbi:MAG: substrate-binding domain-containing protein [Kiritimatiellae bacterium]|nr:substrate-binding domain-containing protein [Kiritimatiellia bacterium]
MRPQVLYLSMIPGNPSHTRKLAGIRRYCAARGWEAEPVAPEDATPEKLPEILRRHRPVGCVVDGVGRSAPLPPRLFRGIPVSYIGYLPGETGQKPNFRFDADAIAKAALRELSAGRPSCYAVVGFKNPLDWSRRRIRAFRAAVAAASAKCHVFPSKPASAGEAWGGFVARLALWLAALPEHCAVFAVSDQVAVRVAEAAHLARRHIPRSLTLLSVDNFTELCEGASPPISSIQLDFEREGFIAANAIGDRLSRVGTKNAILGPLLTVRRKSTSGHGRHESWILQAVETIRHEACDGLTARELISRFPTSKTNFNRRFREAIGHSVLDEILHVRLEKACTLLSRTDTAIGAIPGLCGFGCDRTLDALFRSRFKISMRDWRKRNSRRF